MTDSYFNTRSDNLVLGASGAKISHNAFVCTLLPVHLHQYMHCQRLSLNGLLMLETQMNSFKIL